MGKHLGRRRNRSDGSLARLIRLIAWVVFTPVADEFRRLRRLTVCVLAERAGVAVGRVQQFRHRVRSVILQCGVLWLKPSGINYNL
jgi:hypothetical protein